MPITEFKVPSTSPLNGTNFLVWKVKITSFLESMSLMGVVDGTDVEPTGSGKEDEKKTYHSNCRRAKAILFSNIDDDVTLMVINEKTAKGIWDALSLIYEQKSESNKANLFTQLVTSRMMPNENV